MYGKTATAKPKVGWHNTKCRKGMCACSQEKYYKVYIVGTAVNGLPYVKTPHNEHM